MSRGFVDERTNQLVAAFRYPGEIGFVGTMDLATGKLHKLAELKGMMLYWVTSLAFDPDARKVYYVDDNRAYRDLMEVDVDTGKKRMLLRDARIGDLVVNPRDKSIWASTRMDITWSGPPPYAGFNQIHLRLWQRRLTRYLAGRSMISPALARSTASSRSAWKLQTLEEGGGRRKWPGWTCRRRPRRPLPSPRWQIAHGTSHTGVSNVFRRHRQPAI
jgi:hypothetical protein